MSEANKVEKFSVDWQEGRRETLKIEGQDFVREDFIGAVGDRRVLIRTLKSARVFHPDRLEMFDRAIRELRQSQQQGRTTMAFIP